jgi:hypothetical protein
VQDRTSLPVPVQHGYFDRRITGTPDQVADQVALARRSGRLVAMTEPREMPDGQVWVTVRVLDRPAPVPATRRLRWQVVVPVTVTAAAVLAGTAWAVGRLVDAVAAAAPTIAGGLALLVLVLAVLFRRGHLCTGLHCSGCKG